MAVGAVATSVCCRVMISAMGVVAAELARQDEGGARRGHGCREQRHGAADPGDAEAVRVECHEERQQQEFSQHDSQCTVRGRAWQVPPLVSQVMAEPILYHRAPRSSRSTRACSARLKAVFQTEGDVLVFAASGTGAMESAVANLVRPASAALVASCGKFGERWAEIVRRLRRRRGPPRAPSGASKVDPARGGRRAGARTRRSRVVFTTLSETSTGVVNDVRALTRGRPPPGALIAVDAVSGLGAVPMPQDEWGVDVVGVRVAEGAHVPARARLRERQRARARPRGRGARGAATTSTGRAPRRASARTRRTAPSRRRSALVLRARRGAAA